MVKMRHLKSKRLKKRGFRLKTMVKMGQMRLSGAQCWEGDAWGMVIMGQDAIQ